MVDVRSEAENVQIDLEDLCAPESKDIIKDYKGHVKRT